jgi:hypothetical protein
MLLIMESTLFDNITSVDAPTDVDAPTGVDAPTLSDDRTSAVYRTTRDFINEIIDKICKETTRKISWLEDGNDEYGGGDGDDEDDGKSDEGDDMEDLIVGMEELTLDEMG